MVFFSTAKRKWIILVYHVKCTYLYIHRLICYQRENLFQSFDSGVFLTAEFSKGDPPRNLHSFTVKLLTGPAAGLVSWQGTSLLKLLMPGKRFYGAVSQIPNDACRTSQGA